jgi:hypothetical protein
MSRRLTDEERIARFWSYVDKNGPIPAHAPELGPCWLWTAGRLAGGYGATTLIRGFRTAHRASYFLAHGKASVFTCHRCSVPNCVNDSHLYEGDAFSNSDDKVLHGRSGLSKYLTTSKAVPCPRMIKARAFRDARVARGLRQTELAARVGISRAFVGHIENTLAPMPEWLEEPWARACGVPLSDLPSSNSLSSR